MSNIDLVRAQIILMKFGFINVKRWVEYKPDYTITALEVYCVPLLMDSKVEKIKKLLPGFNVTGNTNQSYILIRKL